MDVIAVRPRRWTWFAAIAMPLAGMQWQYAGPELVRHFAPQAAIVARRLAPHAAKLVGAVVWHQFEQMIGADAETDADIGEVQTDSVFAAAASPETPSPELVLFTEQFAMWVVLAALYVLTLVSIIALSVITRRSWSVIGQSTQSLRHQSCPAL